MLKIVFSSIQNAIKYNMKFQLIFVLVLSLVAPMPLKVDENSHHRQKRQMITGNDPVFGYFWAAAFMDPMFQSQELTNPRANQVNLEGYGYWFGNPNDRPEVDGYLWGDVYGQGSSVGNVI